VTSGMSNPNQNKIRLAILGCGAIVRGQHLPAVLRHPGVQVIGLVDADLSRAEKLRAVNSLGCKTTTDFQTLLAEVDAIINALPNHLHVPVNMAAMDAGVHVLCEKPLATNASDAKLCCEAAERNSVTLAVGMSRRFQSSQLLLERMLRAKQLGRIQDYDWELGTAWSWPASSGFYFSREQAGGGVFIDMGVHVLDALFQWFGPATRFEYRDDNWGSGIEANAILRLRHQDSSGEVAGCVRLSRTYNLRNSLIIRAEKCQVTIHEERPEELILEKAAQDLNTVLPGEVPAPENPFYRQLDNFVESIRGTQPPLVNGRHAWAIIEFIEKCYATGQRIPEPWLNTQALAEIRK
jgi:predicted dehydrogenase